MKKVLLYGINRENLMVMTPIIRESGAAVHLLKNEELHKVLLDVLESEESFEIEDPKYPMTLCLFAGFNKEEIYGVIGEFTKVNVQKPVFATVTQNNINWKVGQVMTDVNQEHAEMTKIAKDQQENN